MRYSTLAFYTCGFITDQSIASLQQIFYSIPVKDKVATPGVSNKYFICSSPYWFGHLLSTWIQ